MVAMLGDGWDGEDMALYRNRHTERPNQIMHPIELSVGMHCRLHYRDGSKPPVVIVEVHDIEDGIIRCKHMNGKVYMHFLTDYGITPYINENGDELWNHSNYITYSEHYSDLDSNPKDIPDVNSLVRNPIYY